jgi:broad specificity phosphatase PhoE
MTARLILVCHASTEAVRRYAFPADEPLDSLGRKSATELAAHLPRSTRCWASPEQRTRQTAEVLKLDAALLPALRDCDYGAWAGSKFDDVLAQDADAVSEWLRDPEVAPPGGESMASVMRRVADWLDDEIAVSGQSIIVTHPTIIRAAIIHAIQAPRTSFWRIDIAPVSITRLSGNQGRWNLTCAGCLPRGDFTRLL